eukprot:scaffold15197_cov68-Phaeocystis_antarctica.AAC.1
MSTGTRAYGTSMGTGPGVEQTIYGKAPAFCAGARVAGSPELDCVNDDESTPIASCRRVYLRVSCTQTARAAHVRAAEAGRVATSASCGTKITAPILILP